VGEGGMFLLMRDLLDEAGALANVSNSTSMRKLTLKTNSAGPSLATPNSISVMVGRVDVDQARRQTVYSGCTPTDWELSASAGGTDPIQLNINYDWVNRKVQAPSSDSSYSAPALNKLWKGDEYAWPDLVVTVGGVQIGTLSSFTLAVNRGLNVERRYLRGDAAKQQPIRNAAPTYGATLECDYDATTAALLEKWGADGLTGPIVATLTGRNDYKTSGASAVYPSIKFTLANAKVEGAEPEMDLGDLTTIGLELSGVDPGDGSTPVMQIEIIAPQTAID